MNGTTSIWTILEPIIPYGVCIALAVSNTIIALPYAISSDLEQSGKWALRLAIFKGAGLCAVYLFLAYLFSSMAGATGRIEDVLKARSFFSNIIGGWGAPAALFMPVIAAVAMRQVRLAGVSEPGIVAGFLRMLFPSVFVAFLLIEISKQ